MKNTLSLLAPLTAFDASDAPAKDSTFVVIFTKNQTYRDIGYDNPVVKTPNLHNDFVSSRRFRWQKTKPTLFELLRSGVNSGEISHGMASNMSNRFALRGQNASPGTS